MQHKHLDLVIETLNEVLDETGLEPFGYSAETNILSESGIDSLGLALVVVKLEEKTSYDPFLDGFVNFQTVGELAELYSNV